MTRWCKCGGSILTSEQEYLGQVCDRCREEQIKNMQDEKEETDGGMDNCELGQGS